MRHIVIGLGMASRICLTAEPVVAEGSGDFFKDKTVTYVVATSAGGGYDLYGRLVALQGGGVTGRDHRR